MSDLRLELVNPDTLGLAFPYNKALVERIKRLASRRWNPTHSRWEVHLSHLTELIELFALRESDVPPDVLACYRERWCAAEVRVELDVLRGRLAGGRLPLEALDAAVSFPVPGYKFSPKYRNKQWDGRRHLFDVRSLTFPAGVWPRLQRVLERQELGFAISGSDRPARRTKPAGDSLGARSPTTPLRDYQRKALMQSMRAGRGVIQMPTGGGKTLLAAHLIQALDRSTIFFVHTLDLLYQSASVFEHELGLEVGILGDGQARLRPLTVATIQTAFRALTGLAPQRISRKIKDVDADDEGLPQERALKLDAATRQQVVDAIESAELVVFDECHHLPADSFYRIAMQTRRAAWRFGLSATPWRDDHQDLLLEAALGPAVSVTNFSDLIRLGHLVPPRIRILLPRPPRIVGGKRVGYPLLYSLAIVENRERNRAIAAQARIWAGEGLSVLVLVAQTAHGKALRELLPEAGFVHGEIDSQIRRQALTDLERKLHPILIATTLADEGLDVPSLNAVILAGGGKSASRTYQRIGRALRPAPGKSEALVLDFMDDLPYLRQHSEARLELYRQEACFQIESDGNHA